jgi:hypothetical protein
LEKVLGGDEAALPTPHRHGLDGLVETGRLVPLLSLASKRASGRRARFLEAPTAARRCQALPSIG